MHRLAFLLFIAAVNLFSPAVCGQESPAQRLAAMTRDAESLSEGKRHTEAIDMAKSALDLAQRSFGGDSRETAKQLGVLALTYQKAQEIAAATAQWKQAVELDERIYGLASMTLAADLTSLGNLYFRGEKFVEARSSFARAVNILLRVTRGEGDVTADAYYNLAIAVAMLPDSEADVVRLHKRSLRIGRKNGSQVYSRIAGSHEILADLFEKERRYPEAEASFRAAVDIQEQLAGFDKGHLAQNYLRLGEVSNDLERYGEAERLFVRALTMAGEIGPEERRTTAYAQLGLAKALRYQSRYLGAESAAEEALATAEEMVEADSEYLYGFLETLAHTKIERGRYAESTKLLKRYVDIRTRHRGDNDQYLIYIYPTLITSLIGEQKFDEAEELARFLLEFGERSYGSAFLVLPNTLVRLLSSSAEVLEIQGRFEDARALYRRAINSFDMFRTITKEKQAGWDEARLLLTFASFLERRKEWDEASALIEEAAGIAAELGSRNDMRTAYVLAAKGQLLQSQRKYAEAKGFLNQSLEIQRRTLRPDDPELALSYAEAASVDFELGDFTEAEGYLRRAIAIQATVYGAGHRETAKLYNRMGHLLARTGKLTEAMHYLAQAAKIDLAEIDSSLVPANSVNANAGLGRLVDRLYDFDGLIKVSYLTGPGGEGQGDFGLGDLFTISQWSQSSEAAFALGQMAARQETGKSDLSILVRERQDLIGERQALDAKLIDLVSKPYVQRAEANEKEIRARLAAIAGRMKAIDETLAKNFPGYAALANPRPLTIEVVQGLLRDDEVLLSYVETAALPPLAAETFLWAVAKRGKPLWVKLPLEPDAMGAKVSALRDLLGVGSGSRAAKAIDSSESSFDLAIAHELYQAVLGPVAEMIAGKQLIVVPSKNLSSLPFHLLVSKAPDPSIEGDEAYRQARWLIRDHAISMLPSISSLAALRRKTATMDAQKPYLAFGNPLLSGANGIDRAAWQAAGCRPANDNKPMLAAAGPALNDRGLSQFFRGNRANVAEVRKLAPLPETVTELCEVARSLKGSAQDLYLGAQATETKLKELSASGELASARIVHFATHGLVAGDLNFLAEPALVLTPPDDPSDEDDGLLTASEVTALKLNADWVILSACNTAAGEQNNAEALSGLARAFFYAGTRGLLVSHWPVYSDAAVEITTGSINRLSASPDTGRAEALRQTLISLIDQGGRHARPAFWAPFVIVGEGS